MSGLNFDFCMSVCINVCTNIYLYVCLSVCLSGCMHACMNVFLYAFIYQHKWMCVDSCWIFLLYDFQSFMYVCMYVCMHVCMFVCMSVCAHGCMHVCMYFCMYACLYAWMSVCMHACMNVFMHACMYVCMSVLSILKPNQPLLLITTMKALTFSVYRKIHPISISSVTWKARDSRLFCWIFDYREIVCGCITLRIDYLIKGEERNIGNISEARKLAEEEELVAYLHTVDHNKLIYTIMAQSDNRRINCKHRDLKWIWIKAWRFSYDNL